MNHPENRCASCDQEIDKYTYAYDMGLCEDCFSPIGKKGLMHKVRMLIVESAKLKRTAYESLYELNKIKVEGDQQ